MSNLTPSIGALSSLKALSVAQNNLNGSLPIQGLCKLKELEELDLSYNLFEGILPPCLSNLRSLTSFANHSNLEVVELISGNDKFEVETEYTDWIPMSQLKFTGPLTNVLSKLSNLNFLDICNNYLLGNITSSIDDMTSLETLILRNNSFEGQFPSALVPSVFMDISYNSFSRSILSFCSNQRLGSVELMYLQGNKFTGLIPRALLNSSNLLTFDIRENNFSGCIPGSNGGVSNLRILLLRGNQLSGSIPINYVN
ncbi:hypothetical protein ACSBR2_042685 [Camellia fascicularis]